MGISNPNPIDLQSKLKIFQKKHKKNIIEKFSNDKESKDNFKTSRHEL